MKRIIILLLSSLSLFFTTSSNAWQHEISIGYGVGDEIEQNYVNHGVVLSGKLYKFCPIDNTLIVTIDGTIAHLISSTSDNNNTTTFALAPAFRAYFADPRFHCYRPYIQASIGPVYLTNRQLGNREQGAHFALQSTLETGMEIGNQQRSLDLNLHLAHYCNAGLAHPNQGINLVAIFCIGYQF